MPKKKVEKIIEMKSKTVSQKSELGSLGMLCLCDAGFAGPNYDISDSPVYFFPILENSIEVTLYDMETTIDPNNKYYSEISDLLRK